MKKTALLVVLISFFMVSRCALAALDRTVLPSVGTSREQAVSINMGTYYHSESDENTVWYKFETSEKGKHYVFLNKVEGYFQCMIIAEIYTPYKESLLKSKGVHNGQSELIEIELEADTQYYMRLYGNAAGMRWNVDTYQFAICGPGQHAGLGEEKVAKKPTCTQDGVSAQVCELCGGWENETVIPATGHNPGDWITEISATCTWDGLLVQNCKTCKSRVASNSIPALGHQPGDWVVTLESTCIQPGVKSIQCTQCNRVLEDEEMPLGEHTPGSMKTVAAATCLQEGRKEQRCSVCNLLMAEETEPAAGHRNPKWETLRDATCTAEGTRAQYCGACGETLNTEKIPPYGHSFGEWAHIEPACTKEGRNTQHCTVCGVEVSFEVLPAYGHQYTEWETVKKATTKEEGQERCHCVRCGDTQMRATEKLSFLEALLGK